jgi:hypothetical protein
MLQKEKNLLIGICNRKLGENTVHELLIAFNQKYLLNLMFIQLNEKKTLGIKLAINTAYSLNKLYRNLSPAKFYILDKIQKLRATPEEEEELRRITILADDIMQIIKNLLFSNNFVEYLVLNDTKYFNIEQSVTINTPEIPWVYAVLCNNNPREMYSKYKRFLSLCAGNYQTLIENLNKINDDLNQLQKLCPLYKLTKWLNLHQDNNPNIYKKLLHFTLATRNLTMPYLISGLISHFKDEQMDITVLKNNIANILRKNIQLYQLASYLMLNNQHHFKFIHILYQRNLHYFNRLSIQLEKDLNNIYR